MANFIASNPTSAAITSGSLTIPAGKAILTTDATATDIEGAIAAGATISGAVADTIDAAVQTVQKGSRLNLAMARVLLSAGADTFAAKGL